MSRSIAELMGVSSAKLHAFLYICDLYIYKEAAIYQFMRDAVDANIDWTPDCINMYYNKTQPINLDIIATIMKKFGYSGDKILTDGDEYHRYATYTFIKNDAPPVYISVFRGYIRMNMGELERLTYFSDCEELIRYSSDFASDEYIAGLKEKRIILYDKVVDETKLAQYKSRGFRVFAPV